MIMLWGPKTYCDVLAKNFPNFILTKVPINFELDFWNLKGVFMVGGHPYQEIKKKLFSSLFSEASLSDFMSNERINTGSVRTVVPASAIHSGRA